jgi:hypothetical protein
MDRHAASRIAAARAATSGEQQQGETSPSSPSSSPSTARLAVLMGKPAVRVRVMAAGDRRDQLHEQQQHSAAEPRTSTTMLEALGLDADAAPTPAVGVLGVGGVKTAAAAFAAAISSTPASAQQQQQQQQQHREDPQPRRWASGDLGGAGDDNGASGSGAGGVLSPVPYNNQRQQQQRSRPAPQPPRPDQWMEKQDRAFVSWLNHLLVPGDAASSAAAHQPPKSTTRGLHPTTPLTDARLTARVHGALVAAYRRDPRLRDAALRLEAAVDAGRLKLRDPRRQLAERAPGEAALSGGGVRALLDYHPFWLRLGLEVVTQRAVPPLGQPIDGQGSGGGLWSSLASRPGSPGGGFGDDNNNNNPGDAAARRAHLGAFARRYLLGDPEMEREWRSMGAVGGGAGSSSAATAGLDEESQWRERGSLAVKRVLLLVLLLDLVASRMLLGPDGSDDARRQAEEEEGDGDEEDDNHRPNRTAANNSLRPPLLFRVGGKIKSSRDAVMTLLHGRLVGEGNVAREVEALALGGPPPRSGRPPALSSLGGAARRLTSSSSTTATTATASQGLPLRYRQGPLAEYPFRVARLATDLRDGLRLVRAAEALSGLPPGALLASARFPAASRPVQLHNSELALAALRAAGAPVDAAPAGGQLGAVGAAGGAPPPPPSSVLPVAAVDLVDGDRERTLALLWAAASALQLPALLPRRGAALRAEAARLRANASAASCRPPRPAAGSLADTDYCAGVLLEWAAAAVAAANEAQRRQWQQRQRWRQQQLAAPPGLGGEQGAATPGGTPGSAAATIPPPVLADPVSDLSLSFSDGRALCAIVALYVPEALDARDIAFPPPPLPTTMATTAAAASDDPSSSNPRRAAAVERNFELLSSALASLGGVPQGMVSPEDDHGSGGGSGDPDERAVALMLGFLSARLIEVSREERAARRVQHEWRAWRARRGLPVLPGGQLSSPAPPSLLYRSAAATTAAANNTAPSAEVARTTLRRWISAATTVQRAYRAWSFRLAVEGMLADVRRQSGAAVALQSAWRGALGRATLARLAVEREETLRLEAEEAEHRRQHQAASRIQAAWRGRQARLALARARSLATTVQAAWRRYSARRAFLRQRAASLRLQSAWRVRLAQQELLDRFNEREGRLREERERERERQRAAATALQSAWRGQMVRWELAAVAEHATVVQTLARGALVRLSFAQQKRGAVILQSAWRATCARWDFNEQRHAALLLQRGARGLLARRQLASLKRQEEERRRAEEARRQAEQQRLLVLQQQRERERAAAGVLQSAWRGCHARLEWSEQRHAAIALQSAWRGCEARLVVGEQRWAAVCLQTFARGLLARQEAMRLLEQERQRQRREQEERQRRLEAEERRRRQEERRRLAATVALQSFARAFLARRAYSQMLEEYRQSRLEFEAAMREMHARMAAATTLQSAWRGVLARRAVQEERWALSVVAPLVARWRDRRELERRWRERRDERRQERVAVVCVQACVRGWLVRSELARLERGIVRLQALWRGHAVRKGLAAEAQRARRRLQEQQAAAVEQQRQQRRQQQQQQQQSQQQPLPLPSARGAAAAKRSIGARAREALSVLLASRTCAQVTQAVSAIEHSTRYSRACCELLLQEDSGGLAALLAFMRLCNRSAPHVAMLVSALGALHNVLRWRGLGERMLREPELVPVLSERLQMFRDTEEVFSPACGVLARLAARDGGSGAGGGGGGGGNGGSNSGENTAPLLARAAARCGAVRQWEAVAHLLARKCDLERRYLGRLEAARHASDAGAPEATRRLVSAARQLGELESLISRVVATARAEGISLERFAGSAAATPRGGGVDGGAGALAAAAMDGAAASALVPPAAALPPLITPRGQQQAHQHQAAPDSAGRPGSASRDWQPKNTVVRGTLRDIKRREEERLAREQEEERERAARAARAAAAGGGGGGRHGGAVSSPSARREEAMRRSVVEEELRRVRAAGGGGGGNNSGLTPRMRAVLQGGGGGGAGAGALLPLSARGRSRRC